MTLKRVKNFQIVQNCKSSLQKKKSKRSRSMIYLLGNHRQSSSIPLQIESERHFFSFDNGVKQNKLMHHNYSKVSVSYDVGRQLVCSIVVCSLGLPSSVDSRLNSVCLSDERRFVESISHYFAIHQLFVRNTKYCTPTMESQPINQQHLFFSNTIRASSSEDIWCCAVNHGARRRMDAGIRFSGACCKHPIKTSFRFCDFDSICSSEVGNGFLTTKNEFWGHCKVFLKFRTR